MAMTLTGPGGSTDIRGALSKAGGTHAHAEGSNTSATASTAHAEGQDCIASGASAHAEGSACTASGGAAHAEGGNCVASGSNSHAQGNSSTASGDYAHVQGVQALAARQAQDALSSGQFAAKGDAQTSVMVLSTSTPDATPKVLTGGGGSATYATAATNVYTLAVNVAATFELLVVARHKVNDTAAGWRIRGVVTRPAAGNVRLVGSVTSETWADASASTWLVDVAADTTNQFLKITVTGEAAKIVGWVARLTVAEILY